MRSTTESKSAPKGEARPVSRASAPSSMSSALESSITTPPASNSPEPISTAATMLPASPATVIAVGVTCSAASPRTSGRIRRSGGREGSRRGPLMPAHRPR